jgi:hypothetical protein
LGRSFVKCLPADDGKGKAKIIMENADFYTTLAQVSAGIFAIAIVTFQIKVEYWRNNTLRHMIAIRTLGEFLSPLFFSLVILYKDHNWQIIGAVVGSVGCLFVFAQHVIGFRRWTRIDKFIQLQLIFSFLMYLEYGAIFVYSTFKPDLSVVSYLLIWLIFSGSVEAWVFLYPSQEQASYAQSKNNNISIAKTGTSNSQNKQEAKPQALKHNKSKPR